MPFRVLLLSTLLIWQVPQTALAKPILPRLEALSFENLADEDTKEALTVWYENRRFCLEIEAMGARPGGSIPVISLRYRIPRCWCA